MRYPERIIGGLIPVAAGVVLFLAAAPGRCADDATTLANFDKLIAEGRYEEADAIIRQDMPFLDDRAAGYLRLAKVESLRFNRQRAFQAFCKGLALARTGAEAEASDDALRLRLRSVRLLRTHGAHDVAQAFLDRLEKSRGVTSALLYERAYLANMKKDMPAYFDAFYAAYVMNP